MIFVISHEDEKFVAFKSRLPAVFCGQPLYRVCVTPKTMPLPVPEWWRESQQRWALVQAHCIALQEAYSAGKDAIIFEQDAIFEEDFDIRYEALMAKRPDDWQQIYLGGWLFYGTENSINKIPDNDFFFQASYVLLCHAFLTRKEIIPAMLNFISQPAWVGHHAIDVRMGQFHSLADSRIYVPAQGWLCGQKAGFSALDQGEHTDRWWHFLLHEQRDGDSSVCSCSSQ